MLSLDLYTDIDREKRVIKDQIIQSQNEGSEEIDESSSLESTSLSTVIDAYLDEKSYDNEKTADKIEHAMEPSI